MVTHPSILLIEDTPDDCELSHLALAKTGLNLALYTEHDAEAALNLLKTGITNSPSKLACILPRRAA